MADNDLAKEHSEDASSTSSQIVLGNVTKDQAFQINGSVGEGRWWKVNKLEIRDNEAAGTSIQVNHAVSEDTIQTLLAHNDRRRTAGGMATNLEIGYRERFK
ncbi:hypothetical protein NHQ30_008136 [Ciborinia camelliae]|nr:hypothetical protein NHQ30_008136 [Ciborinia camelliae]